MLTITPGGLHWFSPEYELSEICAHGTVAVADGAQRFVEPSDTWTVSAAALHLLRTLRTDHSAVTPVAELLIPHCGHSVFVNLDGETVDIVGCNLGLNWSVQHDGDQVRVEFSPELTWVGPGAEWCRAVIDFADAVAAFFDASRPKQFSEANSLDAHAYPVFWREWHRLRSAAPCATSYVEPSVKPPLSK